MLANERKAYICASLEKNGAVTTAQISGDLRVSIETVRRDFLALEQESRLIRVHGGAVSPVQSVERRSFSERTGVNCDKKQILSDTACEFIEEDDIIAVDAGSTAAVFAEVLCRRFQRLTVVTHSLDVFERLQSKNGFKIILIGGTYDAEEKAFCGVTALETYKTLHVNKVFVTPTAVSLQNGLSDCRDTLMAVERQMLYSADSVYVLADSDKFEKTALYRVAPMNARFVLVTDAGLSDELKALYGENGISVIAKG